MTLSTIQFPLDNNTFILNGQMRSISPSEATGEEVQPNDCRAYYRRRLWAGIGLWAFITLSAVVAIPVGVRAVAVAIKAKPAPPTMIQSAPIAGAEGAVVPAAGGTSAEQRRAAPAPNVIDDIRRFAATVTLPIADMTPKKNSLSPPKRVIPHYRIAPKPEEPQDASLGCPPSVCFPWNR